MLSVSRCKIRRFVWSLNLVKKKKRKEKKKKGKKEIDRKKIETNKGMAIKRAMIVLEKNISFVNPI